MKRVLTMPVALAMFRIVYVAFIVSASAKTLVDALHGAPGHHENIGSSHLVLLAASEIVAAILFLFRAGEVFACGVLLVVYAIATGVSVASGDWTLRFVYYAATALFIVLADRNERRAADASRAVRSSPRA